MKRLIHLFLIYSALCSSAYTATKDLDVAVLKALQLQSPSEFTLNDRLNLAGLATEYWNSFNASVPRNSPDDATWLMNELSSLNTGRLNAALGSKQYALSQLEFIGNNCHELFQKLTASIGQSKLNEMYFWLKITQCYANLNETLELLRTAGLSNGQIDGAFSTIHFNAFAKNLSGKIANGVLQD